jgi:hypothetical protein
VPPVMKLSNGFSGSHTLEVVMWVLYDLCGTPIGTFRAQCECGSVRLEVSFSGSLGRDASMPVSICVSCLRTQPDSYLNYGVSSTEAP